MRRLHDKLSPRLTGLPHLADRATHLGGLPHLSCKCGQDKIGDYMERQVTPPRQVTSPTWGPPPLCKQALNSKTSLVTPIPTCITRLQSVYQNITFLQISKNLFLQFTNTFIFFFFMAPLSQLLLSTRTSFIHRHETRNTTNIIFFTIDFTHCSNIT